MSMDALVRFYETLTPADVDRFPEFYADDAWFKDPFNEVTGVAAIQNIFSHMFRQVGEPRFVVDERIVSADGAMLVWRFHFRIRPWCGEPLTLRGVSHLKFDADGTLVSTQVFSGQVLRVDPRTGTKLVLAQLDPGLDNCTFIDGRLFVSSFTGAITEILADGSTRSALPGGLNWPLDLAVGSDGALYVADGTFFYRVGGDGTKDVVGTLFTPGYPGFTRGLVSAGPDEFVVTTANGAVARYRTRTSEHDVLADGFDQLYGVDLAADGTPVVVEQGTGRVLAVRSNGTEVLADGLDMPVGVTVAPDGSVLVSEAGRVAVLANGRAETLVGDLGLPQGLLIRDGLLYIVDAGLKAVLEVDLKTVARQTIATDLPIGAPAGVSPEPLLGMPPFSGPQGPFAGITAAPDGTLYVSADADGSVLALVPDRQ